VLRFGVESSTPQLTFIYFCVIVYLDSKINRLINKGPTMSFETPTFNQINQQATPATVLIHRSNGEISTGQILHQNETTGDAVVGVMLEDGTIGEKQVMKEGLSDETQERLAKELGDQALSTQVVIDNGDDYAFLFADTPVYEEALVDRKAANNPEFQNNQADEASRAQRERVTADHRYNEALRAGATPEDALLSANRAYTR
jgi:hypothetical protein